MNRYKLIKAYPGSPPLGTIATTNKKKNIDYFQFSNNYVPKSSYIDSEIIENNPEYWEEIIEKDYTILSFKYQDGRIFEKTTNDKKPYRDISGGYISDVTLSYPKTLYRYYTIYSIRRESDGEIFTLGDRITTGIIEKFIPAGKTLYCKDIVGSNQSLKYLEKQIRPLFITEDGVHIHEGDYIWEATKCSTHDLWNKPNRFKAKVIDIKVYLQESYKLFSTKEAAEEYIIMNKPCLSINDIRNFDAISHIGMPCLSLDKFKKLVQSKIC